MNLLKVVSVIWVLLLGSSLVFAEEVQTGAPAVEGLGLMPGVNTANVPAASMPVMPAAPALQAQPAMVAPTLTFPPQTGGQPPQAQIAQYPYGGYARQPYTYYSPYRTYPYGYNPYMAQQAMPYRPPAPLPPKKKEVKSWGDTRYIWPDFYTDFTNDMWDKAINSPYDMGYMPGGWRFPSFSSPDPVTVGDAVTNQFPPIAEEAGNFIHF